MSKILVIGQLDEGKGAMIEAATEITIITEDVVFVPVVHEKRPFWSKYGGTRRRPATNQWGVAAPTNVWCCQSCGLNQPPELSPEQFEWPKGELLRVCAICLHDQCVRLFARL